MRYEMLCMIPCEPVAVPTELIARDLGVTREYVNRRIEMLQYAEGFSITRCAHGKHGMVMAFADDWPVLKHNANIYYNSVYGGQSCNRRITFPRTA